MKHFLSTILTVLSLVLAIAPMQVASAQTHISFDDISNWTSSRLAEYVGKEVIFDQPVYICNNYNSLVASMHRQWSPTNQALPGSPEYTTIVDQNRSNTFILSGLSGYHRMGETIYGMRARIKSATSVEYLSCERIEGTRADLEAGLPSVDLSYDQQADTFITHDVLVCGANLEYYLVEAFNGTTSMGPANSTEHQKQRTKVLSALSKINADLYGLVEIQQGQNAIKEIAEDLTRLTGRHFDYIRDGSSTNGTYTKSGYVYCTDVLRPYGEIKENSKEVPQRKKMQGFEVIASGEKFIYSINHFKAKSGNGSGKDADQQDGQGSYNAARVSESRSVLAAYSSNRTYFDDDDILIMGDLNAYAKEDPIMTLIQGGMTDLHRYFHADSSYSYQYHGQLGYLDHALCNSTMLTQVTGMAAYHVNSDESDSYTYDKSSDLTMFRYSDHDPVLVGLKLGAKISKEEETVSNWKELLRKAANGYYSVHTIDGQTFTSGAIGGTDTEIELPTSGIYIISIYTNGKVYSFKCFEIF